MVASWVVGNNGLLGSALCRRLQRTGASLFVPHERFQWDSESEIVLQFESVVQEFSTFVGDQQKWQVFWAAGIGTMGSSEDELALETRVLSTLLKAIGCQPKLIGSEGCFVFASSAGAIYGGAVNVINESTPISPTTAYGREKIKQESLVDAFTKSHLKTTALLARISTLYGPGQAQGKQQGLITSIARRFLQNQPVKIYVPFDTIRDYITADDAAAIIIETLFSINKGYGSLVKIVASERATTIAEIISTFRRVTRRRPLIFISSSKLSLSYSHRIQFKSIFPVNVHIGKTSLLIGIAEVLAAERAACQKKRTRTDLNP